MARTTGTYETTSVAGETVQAFVPHPLPPKRPVLRPEGALAEALHDAGTALAGLEAAGRMVPSLDWYVYAFVRKEAVISSQIEGTQASLDDLLAVEAEAPTKAAPDHIEEICNYLDALSYARGQLRRKGGLPLSVRLLNGTHKRLMSGTRGQHKQPGSLRRSQNWIGGTRPGNARFVPPPPHRVQELLGDLETYLNAEDRLPPLVRAGLAHVQFETIHPYLDGNGRVGRLLISLCLEEWGLLSEPLLYLSLFFKRHRDEYYDRLAAVRIRRRLGRLARLFPGGGQGHRRRIRRHDPGPVRDRRTRPVAVSRIGIRHGPRGPTLREPGPQPDRHREIGRADLRDDQTDSGQGDRLALRSRYPRGDQRTQPGPDLHLSRLPGAAERRD